MSNAPVVLCTGIDAGMADRSQEGVDGNKKENMQAMGAVITQLATLAYNRRSLINVVIL